MTGAPEPRHGRAVAILYGVVGSLIAAALIAAGTWLSRTRVPEDAAVLYTLSENRVGQLGTWHVRLSNRSAYAIDLEFSRPADEVLRVAFDPASNTGSGWSGRLLRGHSLEAMLVTDGQRIPFSRETLESLITASYQERNDDTGVLVQRRAPLREASALPLSRTLWVIFWFLVPFVASGLVVFGGGRLIRAVRGRGVTRPDGAPGSGTG